MSTGLNQHNVFLNFENSYSTESIEKFHNFFLVRTNSTTVLTIITIHTALQKHLQLYSILILFGCLIKGVL